MLLLKLALVPGFLLLLSLAGNRWGPSLAGWLAGLPVVTGPILFFLAAEHGVSFASRAAATALSAVLASVTFSIVYAHGARRAGWPGALLLALAGWAAAAWFLSRLPANVAIALPLALATLLAAPSLFPATAVQPGARASGAAELALRMLAGALLTLAVTLGAGALGERWSGLLAVFPILGIVLAVFSHRAQGVAFAAALLRAMAGGLYSFVGFCCTLALALPRLGLAGGFAAAVLVALAAQLLTRQRAPVR
ncbi:hypothetical protein LJR289_002883 [Pseudoduganella sp. LjRoot289]|uniref:hypothetical protein n=1 Tax=Pseudoduganella sp. LjRoot289 TaxID=3342314 RepID=UPI003ECE8C78